MVDQHHAIRRRLIRQDRAVDRAILAQNMVDGYSPRTARASFFNISFIDCFRQRANRSRRLMRAFTPNRSMVTPSQAENRFIVR